LIFTTAACKRSSLLPAGSSECDFYRDFYCGNELEVIFFFNYTACLQKELVAASRQQRVRGDFCYGNELEVIF
jgi:hypothetical protein